MPLGPARPSEFYYGVENYTPAPTPTNPDAYNTSYTPAKTALAPQYAAPAPAPSDPYGGGYGGGGGGYSLGMDPGYQAALSQQQMGISSLDAELAAARNRAVIEFGDPALAGLAGFGLDPQSADFARQNYLSGNSTMSRLDKARDDARRGIINSLAGRGILFSGETGYQEGEAGSQYGRNVYDARNKVLDALRTVQQNYLDRKQSLNDRLVAAMQNAYQFAVQNGGMYAGAGGGSSSGGGGGVVMGSNGQPYAVGGNPTGYGQGGNTASVSSAGQLDTSGGWGVRWTGPGTYEARKFAPTTPGGQSDTVWVKVG